MKSFKLHIHPLMIDVIVYKPSPYGLVFIHEDRKYKSDPLAKSGLLLDILHYNPIIF